MPNASITNSFSEPGCDFFGVQYATKGHCLSKVIEISSLYESWVKKQLSPQDFAIYQDENHEGNEEMCMDLRDHWYDACQDEIDKVIDEVLPVLTKEPVMA